MIYTYKAKVIDVYDGDTITVDIDLGFNIWKRNEKIRLASINAPEVRGKNKDKGIVVRDYLRLLILNREVTLKTIKDKKEKYGRYLGIIFLNEENINNKLLEENLVKEYKK